MIEVTAKRNVTRPEYKTFSTQVRLHGFDRLTPRAARAALEIAFGNSNSGEVWMNGAGYRVYKNSTRKIQDTSY
jgi:hypothetical protein